MNVNLQIKFAKDQDIIDNSHGEVIAFKAYNFKYNQAQPVPGGLFCQKIFGPVRDHICACGNRMPTMIKFCPTCHVENLMATERAHRFGHIDTHLHYINPLAINLVACALNVNAKSLMKVALGYLMFSIVEVSENESPIQSEDGKYYAINIEEEQFEGNGKFTSVESLYDELKKLNIDGFKTLSNSYNVNVKHYYESGYSLYDFFNTLVAVPPPISRDISIIDGSISYHPINNFYLRILRQGLRAEHIFESADDTLLDLIPRESTILQHVINMLYIEGGTDYFGNDIQPILSTLQSKGGLIRGNLLGKRIDFSGRSTISSGPELPLDTLGVPFEMAYELLKPFIINLLVDDYENEDKINNPYKEAYRSYKNHDYRAVAACFDAAKDATILMNRAPSLHRYSVMAFKMILHTGKFIKVPPMVCSPFNADFDGDTVMLSLVLTDEASNEANSLLRPTDNIMSSIDFDKPNLLPAHEQIIGLYELTK